MSIPGSIIFYPERKYRYFTGIDHEDTAIPVILSVVRGGRH